MCRLCNFESGGIYGARPPKVFKSFTTVPTLTIIVVRGASAKRLGRLHLRPAAPLARASAHSPGTWDSYTAGVGIGRMLGVGRCGSGNGSSGPADFYSRLQSTRAT